MPDRYSSSVKIFYPHFSREELVALLKQRIVALREKLPVTRAVLFGSYAKGKQTAASDIDLLVVYAGEPRPRAYEIVWETIRLRGLEPHVFAESEFQVVMATWEKMLLGSITVDGSDSKD